jgi:Lysozyme like domain
VTSCHGQGGTGILYSYAQLMGLWVNNGGSPAVAPVAAAIAEAESGGCSTALNPADNNGTQSSFGLWQISNGTHNPPAANIYDGNVNARLAVAKYRAAGNQFTPWGTYNSGAYARYLSPGTTPDTSVPGGGQQATLAADTSGQDCALSLGGQHIGILFGHGPSLPSACLIRKTEVRAIIGAMLLTAGGLIILPGVLVLAAFAFRASGAQRAAVQAAGAVSPAGRAAKAAGTAIAGRRAGKRGG